jgi:glycosyltransferase involved in cell wall biosynthesis
VAVDGIPEIIKHRRDGWLVPARDQGALVSAIVELLNQPQLRAALAARGLATVKASFSTARYIRELEEFYREACGDQSVGRTEPVTVERA